MNKRECKVSIIVPVYKVEKYLEQCVDSILKQTVSDFELILVDDGSPDRSGSICDQYGKEDARVKVIHIENRGVSEARNIGIRNATGTYLCFVDSDDWLEETYLEGLLRNMTPGGFALAHFINNDNAAIEETAVSYFTKSDAELSVLSAKGVQGRSFSRIFDGQIIKENNIYFDPEIAICEDVLFNIKYISCISGNILESNEAKYHYRKNHDGALLGRYRKPIPDARDFTVINAYEKMEFFLEKDRRIHSAWAQCRDRAAASTLRTMISCNYSDQNEINRLKKIVRKGCIPFLMGNIGSFSSKISMLISTISPGLEWQLFKTMFYRNEG